MLRSNYPKKNKLISEAVGGRNFIFPLRRGQGGPVFENTPEGRASNTGEKPRQWATTSASSGPNVFP